MHGQPAAAPERSPPPPLPQSPGARSPLPISAAHAAACAPKGALTQAKSARAAPAAWAPLGNDTRAVGNEETDPMKEKACVPLLRRPRQAEVRDRQR